MPDSTYRILHLFDDPNTKKQIDEYLKAHKVNPISQHYHGEMHSEYDISNTPPDAVYVGPYQASPNPEDKPGQGFYSANKRNTGGIPGQTTDNTSIVGDQIGAPLKQFVPGMLGETLLTHLYNLQNSIRKLIARAEDKRIKADSFVENNEQEQSLLKDGQLAMTNLNRWQRKIDNIISDVSEIYSELKDERTYQQLSKPQRLQKLERLLAAYNYYLDNKDTLSKDSRSLENLLEYLEDNAPQQQPTLMP